MDLRGLPLPILVNVFRNLSATDLEELTRLFPPNSEHCLLYRVIDAVRLSRIIVTCSWHSLLVLLPRARQVAPLDVLAHYTHAAIDDFPHLVAAMQSHPYPDIPVKKDLWFVLGSDLGLSYAPERDSLRLIMRFGRILRTIPPSILPTCRHIDFSFAASTNVESQLVVAAAAAMFNRLAHTEGLWLSVENISMSGFACFTDTHHQVYDYSRFQALKVVSLTKMGIESVDQLLLPPTVATLNVSCNKIVSFDGSFLPSDLVTLDISNNRIEGLVSRLPPTLKCLIVRQNRIKDIVDLPDTTEILDISYNPLLCAEFIVPSSLRSLYLDLVQTIMSENVCRRLRAQRVLLKTKHSVTRGPSCFS